MDFDSLGSINKALISQKYESYRADWLYYFNLDIEGKEYDSYLLL